MTTTKHPANATPLPGGKWDVERVDDEEGCINAEVRARGKEGGRSWSILIARVDGRHVDELDARDTNDPEWADDPADAVAVGRAIAAIPDLIAACELVDEWWGKASVAPPTVDVRAVLRAAIAKAKP